MSHRSRLCGFVLDCQDADLDRAAAFWGAALGKAVKPTDPESGGYRVLDTAEDELLMQLQRVDHPSRVHLDLETDNLDAEVARLEKLGAKRVAFVRNRWWVMEAPTGQRFCVCQPQRGPLGADANEWE